MAGPVPASPGHPRPLREASENVDARDIGAKRSFVALPGHDGERDRPAA